MTDTTEVRIRRAPKLSVFLVLGAFVGALGTLILTSLFPADPAVGFAATVGYFLLFGVPAGVAVGATIGLVIDAVSRRRSKVVTAEREVVGELPAAVEPAAVVEPAAAVETPKRRRS